MAVKKQTVFISEKSKARVSENGEVFTPNHIVDKMNNLVPNENWSDPDTFFLEPACGNGQFIVAIFLKRLENGIKIDRALNTLWGMDIMKDNIEDCHRRLFEIIAEKMIEAKIEIGSKKWDNYVARYGSIIENNIFIVKDSLAFISSGKFNRRKFVFSDPTNSGQEMTEKQRNKIVEKVKRKYKLTKDGKNNSYKVFV